MISSNPPQIEVQEFVRAVKTSNPFVRNRVTQADSDSVDIASIHDAEFRQLRRRVTTVRDTGTTAGVLLLGAAGVGKSHLLARLFRWAHEEGAATVVYLHNLLASPARLPRYLLSAIMSSLAGYRPSAYAQSQLYALLNRAVKSKKSLPSAEERATALRKVGAEIDPEGLVMPIFIAFLEQTIAASQGDPDAETRARVAVQWLSGETIEPKQARELGLREEDEEGATIADDVAVQRTLDVVCRLSGRGKRPFVLCVDQVDNLDAEKVTALTSFLHASLDNGHDLVIVTSGVKESMLGFQRQGIVPQAAWDRLAQFKIELNKVGPEEARKIIEGRVQRFMQPFRELPKVRRLSESEPLLPLQASWLDERLAKVIEARPRDVINWARERWEEEQERIEERGTEGWLEFLHEPSARRVRTIRPPRPLEELVDEMVAKKLKEAASERSLYPERLPPDADNLATLTTTLLRACVGNRQYSLRSVERIFGRSAPVTYDISAVEEAPDGTRVRNGIVFVTADNAIKSSWALKRVAEDENPPDHQLLVTDEERRPLKLGPKGKEVFEKLAKSGRFRPLPLSFEDYAWLDALTVVLGSAKVGDLEVEHPPGQIHAVSDAECLASLHRQSCFLKSPLLRELLTEEQATPKPPQAELKPSAEVIRQRMMAELQWRLGMTGREMVELLVAREKLDAEARGSLWPRVLEISKIMHRESLIHATAQDDDLFLQYYVSKKESKNP